LLLTAAIWGFAFVAQRLGNDALNPLLFNGLRFGLGGLAVLILKVFILKRIPDAASGKPPYGRILLLGTVLFIASSLQQTGLLWTTAGSAGFITGLYVVFIPLFGLLVGHILTRGMAVAVGLAVAGLWMINSGAALDATFGNVLVLISALFWALHVLLIGKYTQGTSSLHLAIGQYFVCALLSLAGGVLMLALKVAGFGIRISITKDVLAATAPILYGGIMSVGIAYTLQMHAQKRVKPQAAGIIMCSEAVFAMLGGILFLQERPPALAYLGAALVLAAMLVPKDR
jgi:drug/metabolite transporter (DMT)-like permease